MKHIAYLAGYIDGDGCFFLKHDRFQKPERFRCQLIVSTTNLDIITYFLRQFGGVPECASTKKDHWKQQYHWLLRGRYATDLCKQLEPHLIEKAAQCALFMDFRETRDMNKRTQIMDQMREVRMHPITSATIEDIRRQEITGFQNEAEFAYLAGFIDAECSLSVRKEHPPNRPNPTYKIELRCNNTSPAIFYWLHQRMGGSLAFIDRMTKNTNHQNQIAWQISAKKLSSILPKILPYLIAKRDICELLIRFYETKFPQDIGRKGPRYRALYPVIAAERESLFSQITALNKKGVSKV